MTPIGILVAGCMCVVGALIVLWHVDRDDARLSHHLPQDEPLHIVDVPYDWAEHEEPRGD